MHLLLRLVNSTWKVLVSLVAFQCIVLFLRPDVTAGEKMITTALVSGLLCYFHWKKRQFCHYIMTTIIVGEHLDLTVAQRREENEAFNAIVMQNNLQFDEHDDK